jgi:hypothetical protein
MDLYDYASITGLIRECVAAGILDAMPTMSAERVE